VHGTKNDYGHTVVTVCNFYYFRGFDRDLKLYNMNYCNTGYRNGIFFRYRIRFLEESCLVKLWGHQFSQNNVSLSRNDLRRKAARYDIAGFIR
jgi:hypothetical protein